jgi:hypothetical protein
LAGHVRRRFGDARFTCSALPHARKTPENGAFSDFTLRHADRNRSDNFDQPQSRGGAKHLDNLRQGKMNLAPRSNRQDKFRLDTTSSMSCL